MGLILKKKAEESHRKVLKPHNTNITVANVSITTDNSFEEIIPYYHEFSDTKISQDIRS